MSELQAPSLDLMHCVAQTVFLPTLLLEMSL